MCLNPLTIKNPRRDFNQYIDPLYLQVPCGHCIQCQRSKLIDLETRAVCEYENCKSQNGIVFNYTLTYSEDNVPWYCGIRVLCRRDMQLFKKRLKKSLGDDGDKIKIAYFGEIGKRNTKRSHFHILIYCYKFIDPLYFAELVEKAWSNGFIGFPKKLFNGKPLKPSPYHAVVSGVNAIRYCIKYCTKSCDLRTYLYNSFYSWLYSNGIIDESDIQDFVFPDNERFQFPPKSKMDLDSIVNYFSSCYRVPNNFGVSQLEHLNSNYDYVTKIPYKGDFLKYHISKYCKDKIFNITCIYPNNVKSTHKTKRWIDYNKKLLPIFAQNFENSFLSNRHLQINYTDLPYVDFEGALKSLYDDCHVSLRDYFVYRTLYTTTPLQALSLDAVLRLRQSRDVSYIDLSNYNSLLSFIPIWLSNYADTLKLLYQEIAYNNYLIQWEKDVDYQNVKSFLYGTNPQYPLKLTFNQIINPMIRPKHQPVQSESVPKTYGLVRSSDGQNYERCVVPDPVFPPVSTFDVDSLANAGLSPSLAPPIITQSVEEVQQSISHIDDYTKEI